MCIFIYIVFYIYIYVYVSVCVYTYVYMYVFHRPSGSGRLHLLPFSFIPYEGVLGSLCKLFDLPEGVCHVSRLGHFPTASYPSSFPWCLHLCTSLGLFGVFRGFACFLLPCPPFLFCRLTFTAPSLFFLGC